MFRMSPFMPKVLTRSEKHTLELKVDEENKAAGHYLEPANGY